jgi:hypothetical protein
MKSRVIHLDRTKFIKLFCILFWFYLFFVYDIPRNGVEIQVKEEYWMEKMLDYVRIGEMNQVQFNSTDFVSRFSENLGIPNDPKYYASMSGSMVTLPTKHYLHISRILQLNCDDAYLEDGTYNGNCFQRPLRSFAYASVFDSTFTPVEYTYKGRTFPQILDIYEPDSFAFAGPEDARAILDPWDNVIISFNMAEVTSIRKRRIWSFNITSGSQRQHLFTQTESFQKNWIPFFIKNQMKFIYGWNPFKVVDCTRVYKTCQWDQPNLNIEPIFGGGVGPLRGGSALVRHRGYFVGTVRTHKVCQGTKRVYRPNIVILSPQLQVIYISERLEFKKLFLAPFWPGFPNWDSIPEDGHHARILTTLTMTPAHNQIDWITEFSVNDQKNIIVVLQGFRHFLDAIIEQHKMNKIPIPHLIQQKQDEAANLCDTFDFT